MARIRSVKPELRTSLTAAEWSRDIRYLWVLLWGYLDDHGRGVDDARLIKADCLPLDDDVTRHTIEEWVGVITAAGSLCRYTVNGRNFIHAPDWTKHQRPQHPKDSVIPPCPLACHGRSSTNPPEDFMKPSGGLHEDFTPEVEVEMEMEGEGTSRSGAEKPARGGKRRGTPTTIPDDFSVTDEMRAWARQHTPQSDIERETVKFCNHWRSTSKNATKVDWTKTWQNWLIRAQEYAEERNGRASPHASSPTLLPFDPDDF